MPTKKEPTKPQKVKKDFVDFIKDASGSASKRKKFINELYKEDAHEKDLCKLLHDWGYEGVRIKDCAIVLRLAKTQGPLPGDFQPRY